MKRQRYVNRVLMVAEPFRLVGTGWCKLTPKSAVVHLEKRGQRNAAGDWNWHKVQRGMPCADHIEALNAIGARLIDRERKRRR